MSRHLLQSSALFLFLLALSPAFGCGEPGADGTLDERASAIVNGTPLVDTIGNVNVGGACSGTLLAPNWVLTAGHCTEGGLPAFVTLGNSTAPVLGGKTIYHPSWYNPNLSGTARFVRDAGHDVSLVHLSTKFSTAGYANKLFNFVTNYPAVVGDTLACAGYAGGTAGQLQTATFGVSSVSKMFDPLGLTLMLKANSQSAPVIEMPRNGNQQLAPGDSGGSCYRPTNPYQIVGINQVVNGTDGTGYLHNVTLEKEWIAQQMHGEPCAGCTPQGTPVTGSGATAMTRVVAISGLVMQPGGFTTYILAQYLNPKAGNSPLFVKMVNEGGVDNLAGQGQAVWQPISTSGLPSGGAGTFGLTGAQVGLSPGYNLLVLALIGLDGQLYTTTVTPRLSNIVTNGIRAPDPAWTNLTWTANGSAPNRQTFIGQPAIAFAHPRVDVFAVGSDSKLYTRWKKDYRSNVWASDWMVVNANVTFNRKRGVAVAFTGQNPVENVPPWAQRGYFLSALSDGSTSSSNNGTSAWMALKTLPADPTASYGDPFGMFGNVGGSLASGVSVGVWFGGLNVYAVGTDSELYLRSFTWTGDWSAWLRLGKGAFAATTPSSEGSWANATQLRLMALDSNRNPVIYSFPW